MKRLMGLLLFTANIVCSDAGIYASALKVANKMAKNARIGVLGNRDFECGFYTTAAKKLGHIGETLHPAPNCAGKVSYVPWVSHESLSALMNDNDRQFALARNKCQADCDGSTAYEPYLKTLRASEDARSLYLVGLADLQYPHHLTPNRAAYASFRRAAKLRHEGALFFMGLRACERKKWDVALRYFSKAKGHDLCKALGDYAAKKKDELQKVRSSKNFRFAQKNAAKSIRGKITYPVMNDVVVGRKKWKK